MILDLLPQEKGSHPHFCPVQPPVTLPAHPVRYSGQLSSGPAGHPPRPSPCGRQWSRGHPTLAVPVGLRPGGPMDGREALSQTWSILEHFGASSHGARGGAVGWESAPPALSWSWDRDLRRPGTLVCRWPLRWGRRSVCPQAPVTRWCLASPGPTLLSHHPPPGPPNRSHRKSRPHLTQGLGSNFPLLKGFSLAGALQPCLRASGLGRLLHPGQRRVQE